MLLVTATVVGTLVLGIFVVFVVFVVTAGVATALDTGARDEFSAIAEFSEEVEFLVTVVVGVAGFSEDREFCGVAMLAVNGLFEFVISAASVL